MEGLSENMNDLNEEVVVTYTPSDNYSTDTVAPIITIKNKTYVIKANDKIDFLGDVKATDSIDGDLTNKIESNISSLDFTKEGVKKVEYKVTDSSGNVATETVYVTVKKDNTNIIRLGQVGIFIVIALIIIFLTKYIRSIKLEKRFSKYTINSSKNKYNSLFDSLHLQYLEFISKLTKRLSKSPFLTRKSKKYEKYVTAFDLESSISFYAKKIVSGFLFIIFTILILLLQSKLANVLEMLVSFIVGFYMLDIFYLYRYSKYKNKIEDDMLDSITIMNNAFKAGMSIIQAIDLVSREVNGPISKEFKKIYTDINMGLDIEIAFNRFSKRIKSDEAIYLASSLSVLNKTGGNIIKVFDSIEKNMFSRRKLENELKSLTASSKLIMYVLMIVPPLFMIFISIISKDYFTPMFTNPLGIALLLVMALIYVTYIMVVRKVLKVRGIR